MDVLEVDGELDAGSLGRVFLGELDGDWVDASFPQGAFLPRNPENPEIFPDNCFEGDFLDSDVGGLSQVFELVPDPFGPHPVHYFNSIDYIIIIFHQIILVNATHVD